jgi:two-component system, sensor histidine kinase LadS
MSLNSNFVNVHVAFFTFHTISRLWKHLRWWWLCMLLAQPVWAQAVDQQALDLTKASSPLLVDARGTAQWSLLALQGLDANSTPKQALATDGYTAFKADGIYDLNDKNALWLKFKVKLDPLSQRRWTVMTAKTFLDRVELHYQDAQGQWQMQQAGDSMAHERWSQRTLAPQFKLPALPAGEHTMLIKVVSNLPQQIPISLVEDGVAAVSTHDDFLLSGIIIGLLSVILLLSLHLAINYRDAVYAWYAAYVLLSLLSITSYLGVASYLFWPQAGRWPEYSIFFTVMASVTAQLWFCQAMFLRDTEASRLKRLAQAAALVSSVLLLSPLIFPSTMARQLVFAAGMLICLGLIGLIVAQALMRKMKAAYFWVAAYVPLVVVVTLALLDNLSIISPVGLPYSLPAYTLAFEAMVLLFSLHMHAKNRHAVQERERALVVVDPLTGFFNARAFGQRLALMWSGVMGSNQDIAIALVHVHHSSDSTDSESALRLERKLLRSVRLLNTVTRDVDLIGRIGGNILAVAMPGIPMGDDLNNRLARLIALGLMVDPYDTQTTELRFRVAVGTRATWGDDLKSLDNSLRASIAQSGGWSRKPIRYITPATIFTPAQMVQRQPAVSDSGRVFTGSLDNASSSSRSVDPAALNASLRSSGGQSSKSNSSAPPVSSSPG